MLKDLSIVIPTYNRQQYALRNIHYWSNRGPEIHVLDGSALPVRDELLSSVGPNIHYHHRYPLLFSFKHFDGIF